MIPLFQVDAFTDTPFRGNPAAVCLLDRERPEELLQQIAAEMNLSETAFVSRRDDGDFDLRWFTPTCEVPLCGHATLASSHVLWERGELKPEAPARFWTRSGLLTATRDGDMIHMDLPARVIEPGPLPPPVTEALDVTPRWTGCTPGDDPGALEYILELGSEAEVLAAQPDFARLRQVEGGVIITAAATRGDCDFVSRYFAAYFGIDEDPVTGAAHCCLSPFWSRKLGRSTLVGYQASARGGFVATELRGDRAVLGGTAVTVVTGSLLVP